jgi:Carboxypeptidase regulatory-like domain
MDKRVPANSLLQAGFPDGFRSARGCPLVTQTAILATIDISSPVASSVHSINFPSGRAPGRASYSKSRFPGRSCIIPPRGFSLLISKLAVASLFIVGSLGVGENRSQLKGTVHDPSSAPVVGVHLTLSSLDRALQTESGADGRFQFENVPDGQYDLKLSARGFAKQELPVAISTTVPRSLSIVLQGLNSLPDMSDCGPNPSVTYSSLQAGSPHLTGVVRDYFNKKPIGKATISLWRPGEGRPVSASVSDPMGRFEFKDLPAGHYDLRMSRRTYRSAEFRGLLVPRESGTSVDFPILEAKSMVACQ